MRRHAAVIAILLLEGALTAQPCAFTLLKNDNLPAIPSAGVPVAIIQGLCEGEAAGAVFSTLSLGTTTVRIHEASIAYMNVAGANGIQAAADLEIFDGITWSGGLPVFGPSLFRWSTATGSNIALSSSVVNTAPSLSGWNIIATSGKIVCAWTMTINMGGLTCLQGYSTNFATDYAGGISFTCSPTVTPPQKNLIYIQGLGWRDASTATVNGFQLCPLYYAGNWIMRLCVEPLFPATLSVFGPQNPPPGSFLSLQFSSPSDPGAGYAAAIACATTPGIPWSPFGVIPLAPDACFSYFIHDCLETGQAPYNWAVGFTGTLNGSGLAFGTFQVPPFVPSGFNLNLWFCFVTLTGKISNAAGVIVP